MGIEDEIRSYLHQGFTPKQLIENRNFKKSTVYKVAETIQTFSDNINLPEWSILNIRFNKSDIRYMPGEAVQVNFTFQNQSNRDMYVINIGVQTEWMIKEGKWYSQQIKQLIKPNQSRFISISFPIPRNIGLGEYELLFGVELQYLPATGYENQITTNWSHPLILHIKHPLINNKVFLSHSVKDQFLVRELEKKLDEFGITTYVGEDISNPGSQLDDKFKRLITASNFFIALLTNPALESSWVQMEIEYAKNLNKPMILLKDKSINVSSNYEWIEFSSNDTPQHTFQIIMNALGILQNSGNNNGLIAGAIGIGLLALLVAALSEE